MTGLFSTINIQHHRRLTSLVFLRASHHAGTRLLLIERWPALLTANTKAVCAPATIPINTDFYTNNTALKYTLRSISRLSGTEADSRHENLGTMAYLNNPLHNCSVTAVEIQFANNERESGQIARQQWGATVTGYVRCDIETPEGQNSVVLTTTHDFNPAERWQTTDSHNAEGSLSWLGTIPT